MNLRIGSARRQNRAEDAQVFKDFEASGLYALATRTGEGLSGSVYQASPDTPAGEIDRQSQTRRTGAHNENVTINCAQRRHSRSSSDQTQAARTVGH